MQKLGGNTSKVSTMLSLGEYSQFNTYNFNRNENYVYLKAIIVLIQV